MRDELKQHPHRRILVALDVPTLPEALTLVEHLHDRVGGFKVGLELCSAAGVPRVVEAISAAGGRVFLDLKFKDIPNTVGGAVRAIGASCGKHVGMLTLHCDGGSAMLRAAVSAAHTAYGPAHDDLPLLLGVTVLTSMDQAKLAQVGVHDSVERQVVRLAQLAQMSGLHGVVASPHEVAAIKRTCGATFVTVTPGVRPTWAATADQQRVMTPAEALRRGSDYLVIGRPITAAPPRIGGPVAAAERIAAELAG
jgi:orotidine-5'-phosphate decarboxylase